MIFFKNIKSSVIILDVDELGHVHCLVEVAPLVALSHGRLDLNEKGSTSISDWP